METFSSRMKLLLIHCDKVNIFHRWKLGLSFHYADIKLLSYLIELLDSGVTQALKGAIFL
jgi:hypothetical protein